MHTEEEFFRKTRSFLTELLQLFTDVPVEHCVFVEKTPHNPLNSWIFEKLFDPVKCIWIIRDPRAVVYSTKKQEWGPKTLEEACIYTQQIIRRYEKMKGLGDHLEVRLEQLGANPDAEIERMVRYSGLKIDPSIDPVRQDVIDDWKNYLRGDDLKMVEMRLADEIKQLGY